MTRGSAEPASCDIPPTPVSSGLGSEETPPDSELMFSSMTFEQLSEIIRLLPAAVTVHNESGDIILANEAAAAMFAVPFRSFVNPDTEVTANHALEQRRKSVAHAFVRNQNHTFEETFAYGGATLCFVTTLRAMWIGDQHVMLCTSTDISQQKATELELTRRAFYDELTGLPTRRLMEQHVEDIICASDGRSQFAIAFFDIDNFKHINDYYGHSVGDALLVAFSRRLQSALRPTDMLCRISGDEFLLVLNPVQDEREISDFLDFVLNRIRAPFYLDISEIFASASVGAAIYPQHGRSLSALCQNADIAMYQVKNGTKGGSALFNSEMECEAQERMRTEQALRLAILDKRFCCAFQPKVDIRTEEIRGIEALVRLRDDEGVIQAPGEFINLAVELGLIDELTLLVLAQIRHSLELIDSNFGEGVSISINVAAKQAGNIEFMRTFAEELEKTGCPERFVVEVTEDAFLEKAHFQEQILPMIRGIGVSVSIDDFGIGYSSLSALADITADEIKIDRSFITGIHKRPRSQGILRAIESLSNALGMTVVAEGVETYEELVYLQTSTRIRYAQGYYFSRPIFLEQLTPQSRIAETVRSLMPTRSQPQSRPGGDTTRR